MQPIPMRDWRDGMYVAFDLKLGETFNLSISKLCILPWIITKTTFYTMILLNRSILKLAYLWVSSCVPFYIVYFFIIIPPIEQWRASLKSRYTTVDRKKIKTDIVKPVTRAPIVWAYRDASVGRKLSRGDVSLINNCRILCICRNKHISLVELALTPTKLQIATKNVLVV